MEVLTDDENAGLAPMVAVWMITYNHENFISQAIEGVIKQETSFLVKLFIGDDASTDETVAICKKYASLHPGKIELILHSKNVGAIKNAHAVYAACLNSGAHYIAMCEGDDCWTDPMKLAKQVQLLEKDPRYSLCFHEAQILDENSGELRPYGAFDKDSYNTSDLLIRGAFIPTLSIVFRTRNWSFPEWFLHISIGDIALILMASLHGDIVLIRENMGMYRWHNRGMARQLEANQMELALESVKLLHYFNLHTKFIFEDLIQASNTATLNRFKQHEAYKNTSDTRSLLLKVSSPDFWQRKAKEWKARLSQTPGKEP